MPRCACDDNEIFDSTLSLLDSPADFFALTSFPTPRVAPYQSSSGYTAAIKTQASQKKCSVYSVPGFTPRFWLWALCLAMRVTNSTSCLVVHFSVLLFGSYTRPGHPREASAPTWPSMCSFFVCAIPEEKR